MQNINLFDHPEIVRGAYGLDADENGWIFERLTPELVTLLAINDARAVRCRCAAGVRLAFRTNSQMLGLQLFYTQAHAREIFACDVSVDGGPIQTFAPEQGSGDFSFTAELPGGRDHEVEIHLPHLVVTRLQALVLDDSATLKPARRPAGRLLFLGDSITQGMTCSSPARSWAALTAHILGQDFVNLGVGGATMLAEYGKESKKYDWHTAFVAFGINDYCQNLPLAEFQAAAAVAIKELARRRSAKIYIISPIYYAPGKKANANGDTLTAFRKALETAAAGYTNVEYIDGDTLVPHQDSYLADGLHPNDSGMQSFADRLLARIQ